MMFGIRLVRRLMHKAAEAKHLQEAALSERCIVVDENDKAVGSASKRDCHRVGPGGALILHRAFSVFIFNTNRELLLQRRSAQKVTFPNLMTNACCSHPLHDVEGEQEEKNALGVRRAAQRRLSHELGVPLEEVSPDKMQYITRIHYRDEGDGQWGEHEIDYILILHRDLLLQPNPDEVSEVRYISRDKLDEFLRTENESLTPWFRLIAQHQLRVWWDNLDQLNNFENHTEICRFC